MPSPGTSEIVDRFNDAFQRHDGNAFAELVAEDCVLENTNPAPDGARHVGRAACVEVWQGIATAPNLRFDLEGVSILDDRAIILWRLHFGPNAADWVRGVNLMRVRDGQIVEALGYVKGQ